MTERFESLFDSVKERVSNPLIFSFIFSWLIYNWRVTLALFWFDKEDLKAKGFTNLIDFIVCTLTSNDTWYVPLSIAIVYTILMPILKMLLEWFNAFILKKTNTSLFKITGETPISLKELQELRIKYDEEVNKLASERNQAKEKNERLASFEMKIKQDSEAHTKTVDSLNREIESQKKLTVEVSERNNLISSQLHNLETKLESIKQPIEGMWKVQYTSGITEFYLFLPPNGFNDEKKLFRGQPIKRIKVVSTFFLDNHLVIVGFWDMDKQRLYFDVMKDDKVNQWNGYLNSQSIIMIPEGTKGF